MSTINQIIRSKRQKKTYRSKIPAISGYPQRLGVCLKPFIMKPRKPNSARRKVVRVRFTDGKVVIAYIPGEGHNIQEHSKVFVRGGRTRDLPGVRYRIIRGQKDASPVIRQTARSKYGCKKIKID